jgi:hypothetical protein
MFGIPIDLHLSFQLARPHSPDDDAPLAGRPQAPQRHPRGRPHFTPFGPGQDSKQGRPTLACQHFGEAGNKSSPHRVFQSVDLSGPSLAT